MLLGMELIYGREDSYFSSLRAREAESAILKSGKRVILQGVGAG
jgi:hypothetical protein